LLFADGRGLVRRAEGCCHEPRVLAPARS